MLPTRLRRRGGEMATPFEQMFDRFFRPNLPYPWEEEQVTGNYPVDIREVDDRIVVDAEMPGFRRDDIDISLEDGVLRIAAERRPGEEKEKKGTEHLRERRFTRVERAFTLPAHVEEEKVEARLEEGVLHLEMPKAGESKPRRIKIK